jgi:molybdopterin converting factor small subunit
MKHDDRRMAQGTVRYWAAARAAAGVAEEPFDGATLADVLGAAAARHGAELERVLRVASYLVDGVRADRSTTLADGVTIEVLPPFAGG